MVGAVVFMTRASGRVVVVVMVGAVVVVMWARSWW